MNEDYTKLVEQHGDIIKDFIGFISCFANGVKKNDLFDILCKHCEISLESFYETLDCLDDLIVIEDSKVFNDVDIEEVFDEETLAEYVSKASKYLNNNKATLEMSQLNFSINGHENLQNSETAPKTFGRYEVLEKLGCGAMGEVYKAYDPELDRIVAVKILQNYAVEKGKLRFISEAKATAKMLHAGIAKIFDIGSENSYLFLAMEYIKGLTLDNYIEQKQPSTEKVMEIILQITEALVYAHEKNIVHRDLKPTNIMIRENDVPCIIDFGLAKSVEQNYDLTQSGDMIGTPMYMSPEQIRGLPLDEQSDIFSLGIVMYEALTREHPFRRENKFELFVAIAEMSPRPLCEINEQIPQDINDICLKAIHKDKRIRYATMKEFYHDVKEVVNGSLESSEIAHDTKPHFAKEQRFSLQEKQYTPQGDIEDHVDDYINMCLEKIPQALAVSVIDLETGMLLGIYTKNEHPQEVMDLVAAATKDLFEGDRVLEIENLFSSMRGTKNTGHYFKEFVITSKKLVHYFARFPHATRSVLVIVCPLEVNLGLLLAKARKLLQKVPS
ncbi:serine/threonine protein kinase [Candidatus Uabimicrobium amorphum]|uniref:non-specific serine/threonine protein kinase n=1 Tax=Uabimicrobium amorphum TaxID=2596890 RepID=A0A5S9IPW6_UABAM|nr:serine/threonine-protein kinase [Candidatus Uabimicrobium amorphum]BBM85510.1 protein kinase [Candidatus Uabimicrobium amorphum]